ncbi:hypothetical protein Btru_014786 [Bulinus truncatus]|nr:hypothetical protein Btru_014786 [Bulinus truncatus]
MNTVNFFLICGCSLQCLLGVKGAYNSLGDKYIFLVPPMLNTLSPRIILHLHSPTSPTVTVTDPGQQTISFTVEANVTRLQEFSQLNLKEIYRGVSKAFILTGDGSFSITVQMAPSNLNLATFQALPVSEWGSKYMVVTTDSADGRRGRHRPDDLPQVHQINECICVRVPEQDLQRPGSPSTGFEQVR